MTGDCEESGPSQETLCALEGGGQAKAEAKMRVLGWAAVAVVACAGAAAAEEAQMAAEGDARELSPCSGGRRLGEPDDEVTDGRDLQTVVCKNIKCKIKCNKASGCAWSNKKCRASSG